jgi:hypothetical protein
MISETLCFLLLQKFLHIPLKKTGSPQVVSGKDDTKGECRTESPAVSGG